MGSEAGHHIWDTQPAKTLSLSPCRFGSCLIVLFKVFCQRCWAGGSHCPECSAASSPTQVVALRGLRKQLPAPHCPTPSSSLPAPHFQLPTSSSPLQVPTSSSSLPAPHFPLPAPHFQLPTSHFQLLTVPLPAPHCQLPTSSSPLPAPHSRSPLPAPHSRGPRLTMCSRRLLTARHCAPLQISVACINSGRGSSQLHVSCRPKEASCVAATLEGRSRPEEICLHCNQNGLAMQRKAWKAHGKAWELPRAQKAKQASHAQHVLRRPLE
jgi:hypothetical protein